MESINYITEPKTSILFGALGAPKLPFDHLYFPQLFLYFHVRNLLIVCCTAAFVCLVNILVFAVFNPSHFTLIYQVLAILKKGSVWGGFCRKQTTHTIALCRAYHLQFKSGGHNDIVQSQSSMVTMIHIHSLGV